MKRMIVVLMMLCPVAAMGQTRAAVESFPLTVHVVSSRIEPVSDSTSNSVKGVDMLDLLRVTITGKRFVLAVPVRGRFFGNTRVVLLEPGDYRARVKLDRTPNPGEVQRIYQLRLANGKKVLAYLWGIGL